jgi:hypothetical protein
MHAMHELLHAFRCIATCTTACMHAYGCIHDESIQMHACMHAAATCILAPYVHIMHACCCSSYRCRACTSACMHACTSACIHACDGGNMHGYMWRTPACMH